MNRLTVRVCVCVCWCNRTASPALLFVVWLFLPAGASEVSYTDSDGDEIVFRRNASGRLDYVVNSTPKVSNLTSLVADGLDLVLDGTSEGAWDSERCTTALDMQAVENILRLFEGNGELWPELEAR